MKTTHTKYACTERLLSAASLSSNTGLQDYQNSGNIPAITKPSHLAIFVASVVFLKEGAKKDWTPIIGNPYYSYL